ncbi:hypothetical protein WN943_007699 [Citrus x changshan-huyou]
MRLGESRAMGLVVRVPLSASGGGRAREQPRKVAGEARATISSIETLEEWNVVENKIDDMENGCKWHYSLQNQDFGP